MMQYPHVIKLEWFQIPASTLNDGLSVYYVIISLNGGGGAASNRSWCNEWGKELWPLLMIEQVGFQSD